MDFQKSDFNKAELPRFCQYCQSDLPFTIVQSPLYAPFGFDDLVMFERNKGLVPQGNKRVGHFGDLVDTMRENIFASTTNLTDEYHSKRKKFLEEYNKLRKELIEKNLAIFLHIGRHDDYLDTVSAMVQDKFREKYQELEVEFKKLNQWEMMQRSSGTRYFDMEYYEGQYLKIAYNHASFSKKDLTEYIFENTSLTRIAPQGWRTGGGVNLDFTRRTRALIDEVVGYLIPLIPNDMGVFSKNMNKNNPGAMDNVDHPKNFFQLRNMAQGVKYCVQCGMEQSRGLLVKIDFHPISNREKLTFQGMVSDIEKGFIQVINKIYQEHLDELNNRINKYNLEVGSI